MSQDKRQGLRWVKSGQLTQSPGGRSTGQPGQKMRETEIQWRDDGLTRQDNGRDGDFREEGCCDEV